MPHTRRSGLEPPRYRLATLLVAMALLSGIFALLPVLGPLGAFALLLFLLAVLGHVAGAVMGAKLREIGSQSPVERGELPGEGRACGQLEATDFAPPSRLREHYGWGKRILWLTAAGTVAGAALGGYWLGGALWQQARWLHLAMGLLAFAALGGLWSFLGAIFLKVMLGAFLEASRGADPPR